MIGRTIGRYRIDAELGSGGMGVVYAATDTKLNRPVAIKVLRPEFLQDQDRIVRFEREAQALAALNHPNIAGIHGLEEAGATTVLVLEFVSGATLRDRLRDISPRQALDIAKQIASALEAAHDKGIIHRDLKPANVKITADGTVKVLDFGLAKMLQPTPSVVDLASGSRETAAVSEVGLVIGTAAYMSPEQACGKPVDTRTDIWAFGCVLFEMLAHERPFGGGTITEILASILEREPAWSALPSTTPAAVRQLVRRCLEKDPKRRLRDIGDARIELDDVSSERDSVVVTQPLSVPRRRLVLAVLAAVALAAVAFSAWMIGQSGLAEQTAPRVVSFSIPLPQGTVLSSTLNKQLSISRDGSRIVFVGLGGGRRNLYMRRIENLDSQPLEGGTNGNAPHFSRDGQWIAYVQVGRETLAKLALSGGAPVALAKLNGMRGATIAADGSVVFAESDGTLMHVPPGGVAAVLLKPDRAAGERSFAAPTLLPGDKALLFTAPTADIERYDDSKIVALNLQTKEKRVVLEGGMSARYSSSGHLVYARDGSLLAVPFDPATLSVTGDPVKVVEGVSMSVTAGQAEFDIADDGTLIYAPGPAEGGERRPVWVDRQGKAEPIPVPLRGYLHPRLSPDGRQLAIEVEGATHDLYSYDFGRAVLTKLTFDGMSHWPLWVPRGDRLTFRSGRTGPQSIWRMPADRSGPDERLMTVDVSQSPGSWTPDGKAMAFTQVDGGTAANVYVLAVDRPETPTPLAQTRFAEGSPKFSPDGRWVAYSSNESGRPEVYAQPWPGPGPKVQISTDGGTDATWSRQSGELFYRNGDKMMTVAVRTGDRLTLSTPQVLWTGRYSHGMSTSCGPPGPTSANYDVTADGSRFIMIEDKAQDIVAREIHVVLNWAQQLKGLISARK